MNISHVHLESHYQYLVPKDRAQIISITVSFGKVVPLPWNPLKKRQDFTSQKCLCSSPTT